MEMFKINDYSLYLVISEEYGLGRGALEIARQAISGGVDMIQMREKHKQKDELLELACGLSNLCRENGVLFIVNDDPLLANESGACGVHLGQEDLQKYSIAKTREVMGRDKIIGVSTHSVAELKKADKEDVDYIAYGPIFPTKTKNYFLGTKDMKEVLEIAVKPVFFIGGIQLSNLDELIEEGAKNIAVIRDIVEAEDIVSRTKSFKDRLKERRRVNS
jgi:thiamine-phosphate pyrophosphorylase